MANYSEIKSNEQVQVSYLTVKMESWSKHNQLKILNNGSNPNFAFDSEWIYKYKNTLTLWNDDLKQKEDKIFIKLESQRR